MKSKNSGYRKSLKTDFTQAQIVLRNTRTSKTNLYQAQNVNLNFIHVFSVVSLLYVSHTVCASNIYYVPVIYCAPLGPVARNSLIRPCLSYKYSFMFVTSSRRPQVKRSKIMKTCQLTFEYATLPWRLYLPLQMMGIEINFLNVQTFCLMKNVHEYMVK